ncbi:hypothetical protein [Agrobacterium tumefaciens]|uniref:hypothetical protein n=1 Tax=Agrobacterium tumefaciens TaxID=358 RepID=UPI0021CE86F0|nr:hypothetical protein [Agrobacterium tumefaciens]UXS24209.1 hypothetical protein FY153_06970 [Agrobacterium tumefaciens]UXS52375.1 hypothetical protein FY148_06775 [Agrobacterium tumefaciens]UXS62621.1 hypothetical protein FY147_06775 [Agrobacterium tumefaciens]
MYTIVVDERERERQFENGINKAVRHCKIGKVTRKLPHVTDEMRNAFRGALNPMLPPIFEPNRCFTSGGYVHTTSSGDVPLVPAHGVMM